MKVCSLIVLCCVLLLSNEVFAEGENEGKRGVFSFMAFLYYPDESVVDATGARFLHAGVLIRPNWLISSSIDHSLIDNGFPRKTLLARLGAVAIDANFTLNEDEDEQEREVIQVVRPSIHNLEMWWFTDIIFLKTLLPFNMTYAVAATAITPKRDYMYKNCIILVYAKRYGNTTEDKVLTQLSVELMPASTENCGHHFSETTMTCALDSYETRNAIYDPEFCQGNSGGPLICEGEVMGLQTYIDNNCQQPHLYQLLSSWENLLTCSTQEKCHRDYCSNTCSVTNKDVSAAEDSSPSTPETTRPTIQDVTEFTDVSEESLATAIPVSKIQQASDEALSSILAEVTESQTSTIIPSTTTEFVRTEITTSPVGTESPSSLSNENPTESGRKMDDTHTDGSLNDRAPPKVEEFQQMLKPKMRSAAGRNMRLFQSLFWGLFVLKCMI